MPRCGTVLIRPSASSRGISSRIAPSGRPVISTSSRCDTNWPARISRASRRVGEALVGAVPQLGGPSPLLASIAGARLPHAGGLRHRGVERCDELWLRRGIEIDHRRAHARPRRVLLLVRDQRLDRRQDRMRDDRLDHRPDAGIVDALLGARRPGFPARRWRRRRSSPSRPCAPTSRDRARRRPGSCRSPCAFSSASVFDQVAELSLTPTTMPGKAVFKPADQLDRQRHAGDARQMVDEHVARLRPERGRTAGRTSR